MAEYGVARIGVRGDTAQLERDISQAISRASGAAGTGEDRNLSLIPPSGENSH